MNHSFFQKSILALLFASSILACHTSKKIQKLPEPAVDKVLQEVVISPESSDDIILEDNGMMDEHSDETGMASADYGNELPTYQGSATLINDLIHTKIEVRFDWQNQHVLGKATITAKPHFYATDKLILDANGFDIKKVTMEGQSAPLQYDYDGKELQIKLGKTYNKTDKYNVVVEYIAKPNEGEMGGSDAITEDKGLYFINPLNKEFDKPQQIWTQGETQSNSRWFPTIDRPNQRMTNEVYITVEDRFKTLSNGLMMSSNKNSDGTRTDYWKMDMPHAPYLIMMAIGEFAVVKEKWRTKELSYYVEPKYESNAKNIFKNTPEMMEFFSNKLNLEYPWQKYAQVVVRDYVSGAMENTSAVIFGEFMQGTDRELIDNMQNELVVAHEMFHHWFGDYVTCESWSNLTMNEGFANYSEYLWLENKYGRDAADHHWMEEVDGYVGSSATGKHDLINFAYDNRESMFDAHSYNKGGCVLHMLRNVVGDEAFFASLNLYLSRNKFTAVEGHQLRLAFEEVTGQDLNWFFNQWYYSQGHPMLEISTEYDVNAKQLNVSVIQKQDAKDNEYIYVLPFYIDIYDNNGKLRREKVTLDKREQNFSFEVAQKPSVVNVDGDRVILAERNEMKSPEEYAAQYKYSAAYANRFDAVDALRAGYASDAVAKATFKAALNDKHWAIRAAAVGSADLNDEAILAAISTMTTNDPHSNVRGQALARLSETNDKKYIPVFKQVMDKEQAYPTISSAMQAIYSLDAAEGLAAAQKMESSTNGTLLSSVAGIYAQTGDVKYLPFFEKTINKIEGYDVMTYMAAYTQLARKGDDNSLGQTAQKMTTLGNEAKSPWHRYAAFMAMMGLRQEYGTRAKTGDESHKTSMKTQNDQLKSTMKSIADKESNEQLKAIFEQVLMIP